VEDDEGVVGGALDIEFHAVGPLGDRLGKGGDGVLSSAEAASPMSENERHGCTTPGFRPRRAESRIPWSQPLHRGIAAHSLILRPARGIDWGVDTWH
jgi:hypothetical protein